MAQLQAVDIPVGHGMLEGLLRSPDLGEVSPQMAAVVCHPLPTGGGTMHNKVVFRVAQALGELGMPVLRFNFRGVGRSTGEFDGGRSEPEDVRAALDAMACRFPDIPLCLAGFSFGSKVGLPVGCADARVRQLIGVGVPVSALRVDALSGCTKPKLIIQGEHDEYGPLSELHAWFERLAQPKALITIPEADHFFTEQQQQLRDAVLAYFRPNTLAGGIPQ